MQLVDSVSLDDCLKAPFTYSKDAISQIVFADDSEYLATAVGVFLPFFLGDLDLGHV